jgi:hypothetical protein
MSEDVFEEDDHGTYSAFWPLAVLMLGILLWSGYQSYIAYDQNASIVAALKNADPQIAEAQKAEAQLFSLFQDLVETSAKDANAAQIVKDSHMQLRPPAGSSTDSSSSGSGTSP